jgi:hypothetical protein
MNKEQILDLYGDLPLKFSSYYKYSFSYSAVAPDGVRVHASYGGTSEGIYRYSVTPEKAITLRSGDWDSATVIRDGVVIWEQHAEY